MPGLSRPWRLAFDTMLPTARQVADPFHLVRLGNERTVDVSRMQNETRRPPGPQRRPALPIPGASHQGRRTPRRPLPPQAARPARRQPPPTRSAPPGTPRGAWLALEISDPDLAAAFVGRLGHDLKDQDCPPEVRRLGRTVARWAYQIATWHPARLSNGPTERSTISSSASST